MLKKNRILFIIVLCILMYILLQSGTKFVPIEKLDIPSGIAIDIVKDKKGNKNYLVTLDAYTFNNKDKSNDILIEGAGITIADTREQRQLESNHKFIIGLEKVMLLGEDVAKNGIENALDILFENPFMHDLAWLVICKDKAVDIMRVKVSDYPTSSDYIKGMIDNCKEQSFFSDNYKITDAYVRVDAEGRNLVLPYIEIKDDKIQITGVVLFKKDTMVKKLDLDETKYMNFLRENDVSGILTLQEGFDKQISMSGKVKRKVHCYKNDDNQYVFDLDLEYKGDIVSNSLYEDILKKPDVIHNFEESMAKYTEEKCEAFIDKMQNEYEIDCLELGRVAAATYGRGTGVDWNEVVSKSKINIKVKVIVDKFGRGQYTVKSK